MNQAGLTNPLFKIIKITQQTICKRLIVWYNINVNMSIVSSLISKESIRNQNMIVEYEKELKNLPKGSIKSKTIGKNVYFYLYYRDGKKIISKYLGKDEESITKIKELLIKRNHIESMLKRLKQEQQEIKRLEALL